jgi:hypothetical protein
MPAGMIRLLERDLFWKMPPDVEMEVGPSTIEDLPLVHRRNREVLKTGRSSTSTDGHNDDIRNC